MKEPDVDLVDNLVDEEIESDAIEAGDEPVVEPVAVEPVAADDPVADDPVAVEPVAADDPVADDPVAVDPVPDPAVEEPALEPTIDDPVALAPAVEEPVPEPAVIIDDMDYEETGDNMLEMVVEDMNLYEDGFNTHDKEDIEKPEDGKNETAEKPDHGIHDKPMNHSDDDWRYPEDEYHYASSTSTIALSIPAFILTMLNK